MGRICVDSCWPGQPRYCVCTVSLLLRAIASCTHTAQALYLLSAPLARSGCRPARPLKNPAIPCVPRRSLRHYLRLLYLHGLPTFVQHASSGWSCCPFRRRLAACTENHSFEHHLGGTV